MNEYEEMFVSVTKMEIENADKIIIEFAESVVDDSENALSWSDRVFREAAKKKVLSRFVNAITDVDKPVSFGEFLLKLQDEVLSYAKYSESSCSQSSNHMKREMCAATAQLFGDLQKLGERHG